jgi:putative tricarboxylic transport membrane protein
MLDNLLFCLFGTIFGIFVGLAPGVGVTLPLILSYQFLSDQNILNVLIFYSTLLSASQYFGSIPTLCFGTPGETTGIPLLKIRKQIIDNNQLEKTIVGTSVGSFLGAMLAIFFSIILLQNIPDLTFYLKTYFVLVVAFFGSILCLFFSDNKIYQSLLLFVFGWITSKVGYNINTKEDFFTFGNIYLFGGFPTISIILGMYAFPKILEFVSAKNEIFYYNKKIIIDIYFIGSNIFTILRSSIIGFISGLIPFCGNFISSFLAFFIESKINPKKYYTQAIASEVANNSAYISVLFPLLALGVALTPTEYILLDILEKNNNFINIKNINDIIFCFFIFLIFSNILCLIFSCKTISIIVNIYTKTKIYSTYLFIIFCLYIVATMGRENSQEIYYLITLFGFSFVGYFLRKKDCIPFIFAFLLQNNVENSLHYFISLYF